MMRVTSVLGVALVLALGVWAVQGVDADAAADAAQVAKRQQGELVAASWSPGSHLRAYAEVNWGLFFGRWISDYVGAAVGVEREDGGAEVTAFRVDFTRFILNTWNRCVFMFAYISWEVDPSTAEERENMPEQDDVNATMVGPESVDFNGAVSWFRVFRIVEYVEMNDEPGFQYLGDEVTGHYYLSNPWLTLFGWNNHEREVLTVDGSELDAIRVTASTKDGVFKAEAIISGAAANYDNLLVNPDLTSLSFTVHWFNNDQHPEDPSDVRRYWTSGPSGHPNASIALVTGMAARATSITFGEYEQTMMDGDTETTQMQSALYAGETFLTWSDSSVVYENEVAAGSFTVHHDLQELNSNVAELAPEFDAAVPDATQASTTWSARIVIFSIGGQRSEEIAWSASLGTDVNYALVDDGATANESSEGCFIATAAYGTDMHPHLDTLRAFRDQILAETVLGRQFIDAYYTHSPALASVIAEHDTARAVVRVLLQPLVALASLLV